MSPSNLEKLPVSVLVDQFAALCEAQDSAELRGEYRQLKSQFREMVAIEDELRARPGDQRRALMLLLDHRNMQVRLNAALAILAVCPTEARVALRRIEDSRHFPQAAEAGMTLKALDAGTYAPR
ncbi:MAG: DUF2019 domain-containing protein [Bauldia sp.]|nr:DUF2019 domain-containing protein [Bauldia sp.]